MQGRKTFSITLEEAKKAAREIFALKDYTYDEVGDSAYASSPDGKKTYQLRFAEVPRGTEVSVVIETKSTLGSIFKKKEPFAQDEEVKGLWRLFELQLPDPHEEGFASFIKGLLRDINGGRTEIPVPEGFHVEAVGGGMLRIKERETGMVREVLLPKGTGKVTIGQGHIKVER